MPTADRRADRLDDDDFSTLLAHETLRLLSSWLSLIYRRVSERLGIAGGGAIACGLAATAARHGDVILWTRSDAGAERAQASVAKTCGKLSGEVNAARVRVTTDVADLAEATVVVEAIAEAVDAKAELYRALPDADGALLATTTSSLSVEALAQASGRPERFCGLHVFNPVPRMELVELVFPAAAAPGTRERARALCAELGKTAVEVPDVPGFVVNRLLFPYLFSAVRLMEETGMAAADVDTCMTLGAGHPMGPLALLDLVGLDVSVAIADEIGVEVPGTVRALVADGALGRKSGRGLTL
jgi:3-hydroxybutyryl-CoA dehydrogenase